jgi:F0F1-type ATP synthase epsilon subunit
MQGERAIVLVEGAVPSDAIDVDVAQGKLDDARARIEQSEAGDETVNRFRAERDLEFAENLIRIAGR